MPVSFYRRSKDVAVLVEEEAAEGRDVGDDEAVSGGGGLFGEGGGEGRRGAVAPGDGARRMLRTTSASGFSGSPGLLPSTATNSISGKYLSIRVTVPSWNLLDATASLTPAAARSRSSSGMPG